jgi:uncharacterized membrane protein YGL010W
MYSVCNSTDQLRLINVVILPDKTESKSFFENVYNARKIITKHLTCISTLSVKVRLVLTEIHVQISCNLSVSLHFAPFALRKCPNFGLLQIGSLRIFFVNVSDRILLITVTVFRVYNVFVQSKCRTI